MFLPKSKRCAPAPTQSKRGASPDFNPIENAFAKLKALLRKAAERTIEGLWTRIGECLPAFSPNECKNYFAAAGYDAT
jgi:transposase